MCFVLSNLYQTKRFVCIASLETKQWQPRRLAGSGTGPLGMATTFGCYVFPGLRGTSDGETNLFMVSVLFYLIYEQTFREWGIQRLGKLGSGRASHYSA
jgi:hypothetical protein